MLYFLWLLLRMIALKGTGWTPYMFAVARTGKAIEEKDSIVILDVITSIYK